MLTYRIYQVQYVRLQCNTSIQCDRSVTTQYTIYLIHTIGIEGPHGNEREEDDESILIGAFFITLLNVEEYLKELGPFAMGKFDILAAQVDFDMLDYQRDIGRILCRMVHGIYHSMPVRDNANDVIYDDPPADATFKDSWSIPSLG